MEVHPPEHWVTDVFGKKADELVPAHLITYPSDEVVCVIRHELEESLPCPTFLSENCFPSKRSPEMAWDLVRCPYSN